MIDKKNKTPLVVDLDGTLLKTDSLLESLVLLFNTNIKLFFQSFIWLIRGKAFFKHQLSKYVALNLDLLPFNKDVIEFCKKESKMRHIYLFTGASSTIAKNVAKRFYFIKNFFSSTKSFNNTGHNKLQILKKQFKTFDYIGNSTADIAVWRQSNKSYIVGNYFKTKFLSLFSKNLKSISSNKIIKPIFNAIRIHQWIKNLLVFTPIIFSHSFFNIRLMMDGSLIFIAFCLICSSTYILNDLIDLNSDRAHFKNKHRPFANGDLNVSDGLILSIILFSLSLYIATFIEYLPSLIFLYFFSSLFYSFFFKKILMFDCIFLSVLYVFRIVAASVVLNINITEYFLFFSFFAFLSLAFLKRANELVIIKNKIDRNVKVKILSSRNYSIDDLNILTIFGICSSLLSVVVLFNYVINDVILNLYTNEKYLFLIILMYVFWNAHIWITSNKKGIEYDPIVFAITDKVSIFIILTIFASFVLSL